MHHLHTIAYKVEFLLARVTYLNYSQPSFVFYNIVKVKIKASEGENENKQKTKNMRESEKKSSKYKL